MYINLYVNLWITSTSVVLNFVCVYFCNFKTKRLQISQLYSIIKTQNMFFDNVQSVIQNKIMMKTQAECDNDWKW